jgi:cytolysin-activating lysine-acyltransferase
MVGERGHAQNRDLLSSGSRRATASELVFMLGEITLLFINSPLHRRYRISQLGTLALAAIDLDQFRIYRTPDRPVGYVAWAYLTDEASQAYASDARLLEPQDLRAGDNLWIIEFVAPFGHARHMIRDLRQTVFANARSARSMKRSLSKSPRVARWQRTLGRNLNEAAAPRTPL